VPREGREFHDKIRHRHVILTPDVRDDPAFVSTESRISTRAA
jgi:hypothetical protein